ncbi:glycosyltransferase family 2 protein [Rhodanobacter thiooxydans]|uniref:glycosyltransferase family 2 protein n=1 Tax=Rhodanobacter thiooxydans TaxID=416169 RepID=UPI0009EF45EC|nr:glycosyltransferase family 2 protein [Rhodanobacter thiooxydans]
MNTNRPLISIVIPCFNEEEVIEETHRRISALAASQLAYEFEFVFIDDGSHDQTLRHLRNISTNDERIRVLVFSRNFGHQLAVTAGIDEACGDAVVLMDSDLQDPPEVVPAMLEKWRDGYQVVYGVREDRPGEPRFKLWSAHLFYRFLNRLSDTPIPLDTGDFRLMDRSVVDVLRSLTERDRFVRGLVSWVGFRQFALPYRRSQRFAGTTKYPLRKMIRFASDGIISFSTKPLKVAMHAGICFAGLACVGIIWALLTRLFTNNWVPGWTATIIAVLFLGGLQLLCTGILGEYIGRAYMQGKGRPLYIVSERLGKKAK